MKSLANILAFGALFTLSGVAAAPTRAYEEPPVIVTVTNTITVVYPVTCTTWVQPTDETTTKSERKPVSLTTSLHTTTETEIETTTSAYPSTTSSTTTPCSTTTEETTEETTTAPPTPPPAPTSTTEEYTPPAPPTTTTQEQAPVTEPSSQPSSPPDSSAQSDGDQSFTGTATYYDPGMGSCGVVNGPSDYIAAISHVIMDSAGVANPNNNPYCGKKLSCCSGGGNSITIIITDRCPGCEPGHIDLSPGAFQALGADLSEGVIPITCQWLS